MTTECSEELCAQLGPAAISEEEELLAAKYKVVRALGKRRSGQMKLARHLITGTPVAVKVLRKMEENSPFIQFEVGVMKTLVHPNIIRLFQVITTETRIYLVTELAERGNLLKRMRVGGPMTEDEARRGFRQIVSAMEYCHEQGFIHRDIKMANILVDREGNLKVSDFGMGTNRSVGKRPARVCGTCRYWAPEIFLRQRCDCIKMDSWSLGVVLYTMVTKSLPFKGSSIEDLRDQVVHRKYKIPSHLSKELQDLISELLTVDPDQRPSVEDVLHHPWLKHGEDFTPCSSTDSLPHLPKRSIISAMAFMGYDPYEVRKSIQQRAFNEAMGLYLILEHQAHQDGDHTTPSRPRRPVPAPCPSPTDPAAGRRLAKRTASTPALSLLCLLPPGHLHGDKKPARKVPRAASLPSLSLCPVPSVATQPEEADPGPSCQEPATGQPRPRRRGWKRLTSGIASCLRSLCCFLPPPKTRLRAQKKVAPIPEALHRSS